jgi:hypothetical protein
MHRLHAMQQRLTVGQSPLHASLFRSLVNCICSSFVIALFRVGSCSRGGVHDYASDNDSEAAESSGDDKSVDCAYGKLCGADRPLASGLGFRPLLGDKASKKAESATEAMQGQLMSTRHPCFIRMPSYVQ